MFDLLAVDAPLTIYGAENEAGATRRSQNFRANMVAREMLWRNRHALRRAGLAHLYLVENARRELREPEGDLALGRRLVLRALAERPQEAEHWRWLGYMLTPFSVQSWLRRLDAPRHARRMTGEESGAGS